MAREKKVIAGAINITIHPHTPQKYLDLFRHAYKLKSSAHIFGDQHGLLATQRRLERDQREPGPITGDIFKFTNINKNSMWFNFETNDFATDEEVAEVAVPDHLKPNSARFSYIFFPDKHLLIYEGYYDGNSLGPSNAVRFFSNLFSQDSIREKFGRVDVTHIPAIDELDKAFSMPKKEKIEMIIKRPNPDDHSKTEKRVMERMKAINVSTYEQTYKAGKGQSIDMDKDLKTMSYISAKNGSFSIKGKGINDRPEEYSTAKHPLREKEYYDPEVETAFNTFSNMSKILKNSISKWFNK